MRPNAENPRPLPLKDQMLQWLETEEASQVYEAVRALNSLQHVRGGLASLQYVFNLPSEITHLSQNKQITWLKIQLPIEDIRHAGYFPAGDRLILSTPSEGWQHASIALSFIGKVENEDDSKIVTGMKAKIKSIKHNIFVPDWGSIAFSGLSPSLIQSSPELEQVRNNFLSRNPDFVPAIKMSIDGLEKRGYTILIPEFATTGDIAKAGKFTLLTNK